MTAPMKQKKLLLIEIHFALRCVYNIISFTVTHQERICEKEEKRRYLPSEIYQIGKE